MLATFGLLKYYISVADFCQIILLFCAHFCCMDLCLQYTRTWLCSVSLWCQDNPFYFLLDYPKWIRVVDTYDRYLWHFYNYRKRFGFFFIEHFTLLDLFENRQSFYFSLCVLVMGDLKMDLSFWNLMDCFAERMAVIYLMFSNTLTLLKFSLPFVLQTLHFAPVVVSNLILFV